MPEVMLDRRERATIATLLAGTESAQSERLAMGEGSHVPLRKEAGATLGGLLGLAGSVHLSNLIDQSESPDTDEEGGFSNLRGLRDDVCTRLDWLRRSAQKRLEKPLETYSAEEVLEALTDANANKRPRAKVLVKVGERLAGDLTEALITNVQRVRAELTVVRKDLSAPIRNSGPRLRQLDRLDQELTRATAKQMAKSLDAFADALGTRFGHMLKEAIMALPRGLSDEEFKAIVDGWHEPEGFIHHFEWTVRRLILTLVEAECSAFESFLDSVVALDESAADKTALPEMEDAQEATAALTDELRVTRTG